MGLRMYATNNMTMAKRKIKADLDKLTADELKIYKSVMSNFPATSHETALDVAWQGGIKFQFIPK